MIGQYLSNKNKSTTITKSEIFSELNKALFSLGHGNGQARDDNNLCVPLKIDPIA